MISTPGIGSGLDINAIVNQLVAIESQSLNNIQNRQAIRQAELSNIGTIKNLISTFQEKNTALSDIANLSFFATTTSDENKITASTNASNVSLGSYDIVISQLAEAHKVSSDIFSTKDTSIGATGTVELDVGGNTFQVTIDSSNDTLEGIRDTINNASDNTGVQASILSTNNATTGDPEFRLVLTSNNTGENNTVTLTDISGSVASTLNATNVLTQAQDAEFTIDGFSVKRSSNTVTDAIEGVTLDLKSDDASALTVTISNDDDARNAEIEKLFTEFVEAYNNIITSLDSFFAESRDSTMGFIKRQIRGVVENVSSNPGAFSTLADIGITTDVAVTLTTFSGIEYSENGKLKLDSTRLQNVLETNFDDVVDLLNDSTEGFISNFETVADQILDIEGIIAIREDTLNSQISDLNDDIADEESRLNIYEENLLKQYASLDATLAQLNSTSTFLASQLASIPTP